MDVILIICALLNLALLAFLITLIVRAAEKSRGFGKKDISEMKKQLDVLSRTSENQNRLIMEMSVKMSDSIVRQISVLGGELRETQENQQKHSVEVLMKIENDMKELSRENREGLEKIRTSNSESLDRINNTVNDKLQKTLDDKISRSFETVNKRLAEVYEGLGEMKNVASGVSDLKNVLSNVKTRGIMGELQLSAILSEILAPEQYEEQAAVISGSSERVE